MLDKSLVQAIDFFWSEINSNLTEHSLKNKSLNVSKCQAFAAILYLKFSLVNVSENRTLRTIWKITKIILCFLHFSQSDIEEN